MKEINIYGTGDNAIRFFLNNKNSYKIKTFIEGKKKLENIQFGIDIVIPVISLECARAALKSYYTVIASSEQVYWEIKEILEKVHNLTEFENFEYFETFGKKVAIIYGNCHTEPIKQILRQSKEFDNQYGFYPIKQIQEIYKKGGEELQLYAVEHCDLFMHQSIRKENIYGQSFASEEIIKRLKPNCRIIGIPNVYRMPRFLFPQVSYDNTIMHNGMKYFAFRDIFIDKNKDLPIDSLCEMIQDDSLIPASDIINAKDEFLYKLGEREQQWDFPISDFIINRLQKEQLFFDPNHPTSSIIEYIAKKVMDILGMKGNVSFTGNIQKLDIFEIPLYGAVRKALHIVYSQNFMRCWSLSTLDRRPIDIKSYTEQYIKWHFHI